MQARPQSDYMILNWVSATTMHSSNTNNTVHNLYTIEKYHHSLVMWTFVWPWINENHTVFFPVAPDMISKCKQLSHCDVINTWSARYCDVMMTDCSDMVSMDAFLSQWCCYLGWFGMAIQCCCVYYDYWSSLLHGKIEIDHSCATECHGWCYYTQHTSAVVCINTNHSSQQSIMVHSFIKALLINALLMYWNYRNC